MTDEFPPPPPIDAPHPTPDGVRVTKNASKVSRSTTREWRLSQDPNAPSGPEAVTEIDLGEAGGGRRMTIRHGGKNTIAIVALIFGIVIAIFVAVIVAIVVISKSLIGTAGDMLDGAFDGALGPNQTIVWDVIEDN